jgi:TonB family protein
MSQHVASEIVVSCLDGFDTGAVPGLVCLGPNADFGKPWFAGRTGTARLEFGGTRFGIRRHGASERGAVQPPQALATPDPLLNENELNSKASVSFIVGTDGRVHSALILESAGANEDRTILDAVRFWRYRPALCNGVPTEAEAKVEFSSR